MSEDIIERLKYLRDNVTQETSEEHIAQLEAIIDEAIAEIKFLRLHAGAVTRGESFDDISKRVGIQPKRED